MNASMPHKQERLQAILAPAPVVAVVTIDDAGVAVALAQALIDGGIGAIEITLRTPAALDAIRAIARDVPQAAVGAGTVLSATDLHAAAAAGARFAVSPGASSALLDAADTSTLPLLPGAATASEAMRLSERGYCLQKFFPAEPAGGVEYLRALAGPLPHICFCPTGGIRVDNAAAYLRLPNVACVGGSWLTPPALVRAQDWPAVTALARAAAALRG
ncbi:MAG: bifunctional 4-hydroxy-2-oxoglutarate aldolase/2-dehydro-3-deoxy-phosphogluconate aldolase [Xanthomonadaceae bacterium]|nr:bifunctional 4-hydroxy-2-oxoglutarate aldolase/2-dehydro-3-deoxy-phosphogluconate aldolase [Xanthomonadaceae bacterium]MDE1885375.1 bifunctional 4-hydroxy-2-oxoglutarate aldolase/2-dehydro-3-deoxy-phosphogluconate aldolase [Xanthomonadaceae bacterium]MDE1961338.1 bifunctional 4-hydroxy-2-oxoglutarate aldolase/2-dehydro-3-deoxy-phosphogluconate aldolase [Xanthomonadaceae bacterium]MDE2084218.1 bifunctional 4-hydroxy-2-oxoglutarate aldolase/2-dehydro-3-deoxy-phosphogluconate aldolase [Xanthomon